LVATSAYLFKLHQQQAVIQKSLREQIQLLRRIADAEAKASGTMEKTVDTCERSLHDLLVRLGIDPESVAQRGQPPPGRIAVGIGGEDADAD
jgi:hypothetical protein